MFVILKHERGSMNNWHRANECQTPERCVSLVGWKWDRQLADEKVVCLTDKAKKEESQKVYYNEQRMLAQGMWEPGLTRSVFQEFPRDEFWVEEINAKPR